jgi:hypothetical protein
VADFFTRVDLSGVNSFSDPGAFIAFQFESLEQTVHNDSAAAAAIVEVSFDGVQVHARLQGTGPSKVINWSQHVRSKLWLRRAAGGPPGAHWVEVLAITR